MIGTMVLEIRFSVSKESSFAVGGEWEKFHFANPDEFVQEIMHFTACC